MEEKLQLWHEQGKKSKVAEGLAEKSALCCVRKGKRIWPRIIMDFRFQVSFMQLLYRFYYRHSAI